VFKIGVHFCERICYHYIFGFNFQVGVALVATCIVLKFYFHNPAVSEMPAWVRIIVLTWLAKLLKYDVKSKRNSMRKHSVFVEVSDGHNREFDIGKILYFMTCFCYQLF